MFFFLDYSLAILHQQKFKKGMKKRKKEIYPDIWFKVKYLFCLQSLTLFCEFRRWTYNDPLRAKYNAKMAGMNAPIAKPKGSKKLKDWETR